MTTAMCGALSDGETRASTGAARLCSKRRRGESLEPVAAGPTAPDRPDGLIVRPGSPHSRVLLPSCVCIFFFKGSYK